MSPYETVWIFNTAHFTVSLDVAPEEMDPEGNFASGDDDLESDSNRFCNARSLVLLEKISVCIDHAAARRRDISLTLAM